MRSVQHVANGDKLMNNERELNNQKTKMVPPHYKSRPFSSKYANNEILWALKMELPSIRF